MRILAAVYLCLTFQGVQGHVLRTNQDAAIQTAAHQRDGTPDHDWRRAGDGTTRALQTHVSIDRAAVAVFRLPADEPALGCPAETAALTARLATAGRPPTPLRV